MNREIMSTTSKYFEGLLSGRNMNVATNRRKLFDEFMAEEENIHLVHQVSKIESLLMGKWNLVNRIRDIAEQQVLIPNATVGKPYEAHLDLVKLKWIDMIFTSVSGLEEVGLSYDSESEKITGTPTQSGDLKFTFKYRLRDEAEDSQLNEKQISLVVNPDPKSLWKNIDSDKTASFWKEDNVSAFGKLGDRHIVAASKRGRSHANVGSFRDDDFAYTHFDNNGWSVVAVSDGAGSAKSSRHGSQVACNCVVEYFRENLTEELLSQLDILMKEYSDGTVEDAQKKLNLFLYNNLGKAALSVYKKLEAVAGSTGMPIKELHATLIFVLIKKYEFGYAVLSFGVGDCPIGLLNKDMSEVTLMNWLDVGEFGGGTRFITMPEIFQSEKFATRFNFKLVPDFSYLMLMTDGIYDPKFIVEASLEKVEKWREFVEDLGGKNEDNASVTFDPANEKIGEQLSTWMDFWSPGNHDDRTLVIIY